jgi:phosphate transport system substrate-binding protein
MFKQSKLVSALAVAGVALFGAQSAQAQVIKIDGSSTVYPITEAVAEEFQKAKKNAIKVTVGISGTGGGFKKFCRDETDIRQRLASDHCQGNGRLQGRRRRSTSKCRLPSTR